MMSPNVAVWFEIPVSDLARAIGFYETVFAVTLSQSGCPSGMPIRLALFPADKDAVTGCLIEHEDAKPGGDGPVIYLNGGSDLSEPLARAEAAGAGSSCPRPRSPPNSVSSRNSSTAKATASAFIR